MSLGAKEIAAFLGSDDAEHIIRSFGRLNPDVRSNFVATLMSVASLEPVYLHVEIPQGMGKTSRPPRLEHHDEPREVEAAREPEREPEVPRETAREPEREPAGDERGFYSETRELRIIERRLRDRSSIEEIRKIEGIPYNDVKVILDAARERGIPVDTPRYTPKGKPTVRAVAVAAKATPVRTKKTETLPPLPTELGPEVKRVGVELRLQGYGPTLVAKSLGVDTQMIQNAVWDAMKKDPTLVRPEINLDLPPLADHPLKALVIGARIAQGVLVLPKSGTAEAA